jgi:hypothetical protein
MKNKLLCILVLTLLISTMLLPIVTSLNIFQNEQIEKNEDKRPEYSTIPTFTYPPYRFWNKDWDFWNNPSNLIAIPTGNVGIGTDYPSSKLEIVGDVAIVNPNDPNDKLTISSGDNDATLIFQKDGGTLGPINIDSNGGISAEGFYAYFGYTAEWGDIWVKQGDITVNGKGTFSGGIDPPYISFSDETHDTIREYAKDVEGHEKVMQFWNGVAHRMEIYVINEDLFYTITGELIEE